MSFHPLRPKDIGAVLLLKSILILGIELVFCRLLPRVARVEID